MDSVTIFSTLFWVKNLDLCHVNRQKRFREIVRVSEDIREKRVYIYVVVDYAETTMTTQTTTENCGGLSLILKEQSIEKSTFFLFLSKR